MTRPDLEAWDYAMILLGMWLCYVAGTALWIEADVQNAIGLQNGVMEMMK